MKRSFACLLVVALVGFAGCNSQSTPGGPAASNRGDNKPLVGRADDTFTLDPPNLATKLKQGESKAVAMGIKRGKNFDQDVTLKFENLPTGTSIEPASPVIKHGDTEAKLTITAADDAALGDFSVRVTGHPTKGSDASNELKVTVAKKQLEGRKSEKVQDMATSAAQLAGKVKDTAEEWASSVGGAALQAKHKAQEVAGAAAEKVADLGQKVTALTRRYPLPALLVGVGVGFLLGQMMRRPPSAGT